MSNSRHSTNYIWIIGISREERNNGPEEIFEKIVATVFPKLMKNMKSQFEIGINHMEENTKRSMLSAS